MQIVHLINDFLFDLFPEVKKGDIEGLKKSLIEFYTIGDDYPTIEIINELLVLNFTDIKKSVSSNQFQKVISLCEKGEFDIAKPILLDLIDKDPSKSEYHRIFGQVLSEQGNQDEAINYLIDSLKWNPKNSAALLMMGNIFSKYKNDIDTALKYYQQALLVNPKDNITINNIGANLMQEGKLSEAKKYFEQALSIQDDYPNTHFALGMIAEREENLNSAFNHVLKSLELNKNKDILYQNSLSKLKELAQKIINTGRGENIYNCFLNKLETEGGRKIQIVEDNTIPTAAKIEFAENYNREFHLIKYNSKYSAFEHLIMHELMHLDFVIKARKQDSNLLFISNNEQRNIFIKSLENETFKLYKKGYEEESIAGFINSLYDGINRQIFNTPIDLLIENRLFNDFIELRPYQYISLLNLTLEGLKAVTDKKIIELCPKKPLSVSKTYNLTSAMQFKELFAIDFTNDYNSTINELKQAEQFYNEFLDYRNETEPAEEYELVYNWAKDLGLTDYFSLVDELEYRNKDKDLLQVLKDIEEDPFDLDTVDEIRELKIREFKASHKENDLNMAVVLYMVDALKYFDKLDKSKIKEIAFEIGMLGRQGFDPQKKGYKLNLIPDKSFSGYKILSYYYISWKLAIPEMVDKLGLPFELEYELAKDLNL